MRECTECIAAFHGSLEANSMKDAGRKGTARFAGSKLRQGGRFRQEMTNFFERQYLKLPSWLQRLHLQVGARTGARSVVQKWGHNHHQIVYECRGILLPTSAEPSKKRALDDGGWAATKALRGCNVRQHTNNLYFASMMIKQGPTLHLLVDRRRRFRPA